MIVQQHTLGAIYEDSFPLKALTCIPVVGSFIKIGIQDTLLQRLSTTESSDTASINNRIFLIKVKNHYNVADLVRTAAIIAILTAEFAAGLFIGMHAFFGVLVGIAVLLAVKGIHAIYANHQNIKQLQTVGFTPGVPVY